MTAEASSAATPIKYGSPTKADFRRLKLKGFIEAAAVHKYLPGNFAVTSTHTPAYHEYLRSEGLTCWECTYTDAGAKRRVYDLYAVKACSRDLKLAEKLAKKAKAVVVDPQQELDLRIAVAQEAAVPSEVVSVQSAAVAHVNSRLDSVELNMNVLTSKIDALLDMFKPTDVTEADDGSQIGELAK